jgi:hypothetical protein
LTAKTLSRIRGIVFSSLKAGINMESVAAICLKRSDLFRFLVGSQT